MRLLMIVLALAMSAASLAAPPLSERSPLRHGLWWDSEHNGHGFDFHLNGRQLGLLWFSFRADGSPVWYLAGGELDEQGRLQAPLLETRWQNGVFSSQEVGIIAVQRVHHEHVQLDWMLPGASGRWQLRPFRVGATLPEHDPSGAYFDPQRSGFGITIDQQGEVQSTVAYFYDAQGRPVWWIGTRLAANLDLLLQRFDGPCPSCTPRPLALLNSVPARLAVANGQLNYQAIENSQFLSPEFRQLSLSRFTAAPSSRQADFRLAHFDDAASLKRFIEISMLDPQNWASSLSGIDFSPPPPSTPVAISQSNLVVEGVDEGDSSKSDGRHIYSFASHESGSHLLPRIRIAKIEADGPELSIAGQLELALPAETRFERQLYLAGNRLLTLATSINETQFIQFSPMPSDVWLNRKTQLELYDRTDPIAPQLLWRAELDGQLVDSRRVGKQLYLVLRYTPRVEGFAHGASDASRIAANRALLEATSLDALLPGIKINDESRQAVVRADRVLLPPQGQRRAQPDLAVVMRIDIDNPQNLESLAVVGGVDAIHVSEQSLYLTSSRYTQPINSFQLPPVGLYSTDIHRIELAADGIEASASGAIDGLIEGNALLQPFRLSEHNGMLRVLSFGDFAAAGANKLTVLAPSTIVPGLLRTVSTLPNLDRSAPIGKPGERLYASRFVGDRLYAVTYQQVDPLYVIDIANPAKPEIRGELEIPGFSEYLHPLNENLLFGVGQNTVVVDGNSFFDGMKVALFDVSNPDAPRMLAEQRLGERGTGSSLQRSHHAFSVFPESEGKWRVAFPIRIHGTPTPSSPSPPGWPSSKSWTHSGLYTFQVDAAAAEPRLQIGAPIIVLRASASPAQVDDAARGARAFQLQNGAIYVNGGRYWTARWNAPELIDGPR